MIQHLVEKWKHDHRTLIIDEAEYDFNAYFIPENKYTGTVPSPIYGPINSIQNEKSLPEPIYIPKPTYDAVSPDGKTYIPPPPQQTPRNHTQFTNYPQQYYNNGQFPSNQIEYNNKYINQPYRYQQNYYATIGQPQIIHHEDEWLKR